MNYRLVATDLDGTLLDREGKISTENWSAIEEMKARRVHFVPASGRCLAELPVELRESELIRYYILSGGAVIYDKAKDHFDKTCPAKAIKDRILDTVFQYPVCLAWFVLLLYPADHLGCERNKRLLQPLLRQRTAFWPAGRPVRSLPQEGHSKMDEKQMVPLWFSDILFCHVLCDALEHLSGICRSAGPESGSNAVMDL